MAKQVRPNIRRWSNWLMGGLLWAIVSTAPAQAQEPSLREISERFWRSLSQRPTQANSAADIGLDERILQSSPVLRRWLAQPPNLLDEIRNTPAVPTRFQIGLDSFTAWTVGIQDLRLFSRLTLSGDYRQSLDRPQDQQYGSNLRYYLAPLGSVLNIAPQVGYRRLERADRTVSGLHYGLFAVLALAPGAADLTASYSLLPPNGGREGEATLAEITAAYAISSTFRLATRYSWRNTTISKDSTLGIVLEWVP